MANKLKPACVKCLNIYRSTCAVFTNPAYQWRKRECWGRVTDQAVLDKREKEIAEYMAKYNSQKAI